MEYITPLIERKRFRLILRNEWHRHSNGETNIIQIGKGRFHDREEYLFALLGFQLALFIN